MPDYVIMRVNRLQTKSDLDGGPATAGVRTLAPISIPKGHRSTSIMALRAWWVLWIGPRPSAIPQSALARFFAIVRRGPLSSL